MKFREKSGIAQNQEKSGKIRNNQENQEVLDGLYSTFYILEIKLHLR